MDHTLTLYFFLLTFIFNFSFFSLWLTPEPCPSSLDKIPFIPFYSIFCLRKRFPFFQTLTFCLFFTFTAFFLFFTLWKGSLFFLYYFKEMFLCIFFSLRRNSFLSLTWKKRRFIFTRFTVGCCQSVAVVHTVSIYLYLQQSPLLLESIHIFLFPNHLFILCKIFALSKYLRRQVFFLKLCFSWAKRKKRTVCIVAVTSRAPKNTTKKKTWNKSFSQAPHPGGSAL